MGLQSQEFLDGLGDEWLERNRPDIGKGPDLPMALLQSMKPGKVLEIGCGNGWRLKKLQDLGWDVAGIEPSMIAVDEANELIGRCVVLRGLAHNSGWDAEFDVVIMGFVMCLTDQEDWPQIVSNVDKQLKMKGHLLVHDFEWNNDEHIYSSTITPDKPYHPFTLCSIYWPNLWIGFPTYQVTHVAKETGTKKICYMLKKDNYFGTQG